MFAKTVTYEDFDGEKRTETYMFNLTKSELLMWITTEGEYTLDKVLERLVEKKNGRQIMETVEDLLHRSYGVKSLDGRKFEKSEEIWKDFFYTEAYSQIFMELVTDENKTAEFVNGLVSKDLAEAVAKEIEKGKGNLIPITQ